MVSLEYAVEAGLPDMVLLWLGMNGQDTLTKLAIIIFAFESRHLFIRFASSRCYQLSDSSNIEDLLASHCVETLASYANICQQLPAGLIEAKSIPQETLI